ncbi:carboxylesterase/lipase family protein [Sphingomonas sp. Leaf412]|uniref:carboxylesterase/lipase family protein n=1 Tax=Sphingomonas sp. Leaf412 TaxID=1736370 RepID=UPI000A823120|nr:carboxylesterase family protein [Sphingomonas sp. Leaf412]
MKTLLLIPALLPAVAAAQAPPVAATGQGRVRGTVSAGVEAFRGIPFAAPPVGANRWRAPQPAAAWTGVRDATRFGADCMQKPFPSDAAPLGTTPAEDCLFVNVWRPAGVKAGARLPVVVWIYGGGFVNGGASPAVYDGAAFATAGTVFVSFNYRLGRFGFFAHPALAAEGRVANWGLLDQQAALRWVRRNIAAFGGDAANVTVMGESAGGRSVLALLGAPAARGLFARAVVMSGGGRTLLDSPADAAAAAAVAFARGAGVDGTDAAALARLRALPADAVVDDLNLATLGGSAATFAGAAVDGVTVTGTAEAMLGAGTQARVPVMVGATSNDIGWTAAPTKDALFAGFGADAAAARAAYDPAGTVPLPALSAATGADRTMVEPARFVAARVAAGGQPAYHYRFGYVAASMRDEWPGAPHATDIPYFLDTVATKYGAALTPADAAMARAVNAYVVAFAKTGVPAVAGLPAWGRFAGKGPLMDFTASGVPVAGPDPWRARLDLTERAAGK